MCASRNRRRLSAAALAVLSMFSCSYGDREDKEEDEQAKRAAVVLEPAERPLPREDAVSITPTLS